MPSTIGQLAAFALAIGRYWSTAAPIIDREMRRWRGHAERIPDPTLRGYALGNLRNAAAHVQVAGLILTLAPRPHRAAALEAAIALEVAYDYLDSVTEQLRPDMLAHGARLYQAFVFALGGPRPREPLDDGGYLALLAATCRLAFLALPAAAVVEAQACRIARLCGEAQTRAHAVSQLGSGQLADWSREHPYGTLAWWEAAAGWCASVLALHALIAAAADPATTPADVKTISAAYLRISTLTTLLDSLKDHRDDAAAGAHGFVSYYHDNELSRRLADIARAALHAASRTRHAAHQTMTVAGCAAFYCSAIDDNDTGPLLAELQPVASPILWTFKAWRATSRLRH